MIEISTLSHAVTPNFEGVDEMSKIRKIGRIQKSHYEIVSNHPEIFSGNSPYFTLSYHWIIHTISPIFAKLKGAFFTYIYLKTGVNRLIDPNYDNLGQFFRAGLLVTTRSLERTAQKLGVTHGTIKSHFQKLENAELITIIPYVLNLPEFTGQKNLIVLGWWTGILDPEAEYGRIIKSQVFFDEVVASRFLDRQIRCSSKDHL